MSIFDFLKRKSKVRQPEENWQVAVSQEAMIVKDPNGDTRSVAKNCLFSVIIETNDSGPWGADFWWLLFDEKGDLACTFPQGATGEADVISYLMQLEGFDLTSMTDAMRSTDNMTFPVWKRPALQ